MSKPPQWLSRAMAVLAMAALSACPEQPVSLNPRPSNAPANQPGNPPVNQPAQPVVDAPGNELTAFTELSELDNARYADTAIDAQGTIHVIFSEVPQGGKATVFYRASRDGGKTWSETFTLSDLDRSKAAGVPHLAIDGQGRVYAAWKAMTESDTQDSIRGGAYGAPLVYRVLENGSWSDLQTIDSNGLVRGWFLSTDPKGQTHAVWVENGIADDGYKTISASRFAQASLTGTEVGPERELYAPGPTRPDDPGHIWYLPNYGGLRGYVDAEGTAHWTAFKVPAEKAEEDSLVVHWDGTQEREVQRYADYATFVGPYYNPPELLRDAQGQDHILLQDVKAPRHALLDINPSTGARGTAYATPPKSELKTFQIVRGKAGEVAALLSFKDATAPKPTFGLYVSRLVNGAWTEPIDVTGNAARIATEGDIDVSNNVAVYEPSYASGAFDAQGHLNLTMVASEIGTTGSLYAASQVFFGRL